MPKSRGIRMKRKNLGFIPQGCDESRMIKWRDKCLLYLAVKFRNGEFPSHQFSIHERKSKPGQMGENVDIDRTGLWDEVRKVGEPVPPEITVPIIFQ